MRHPMYFGAALAIAGAALFYQSPLLLAYASVFLCSPTSSSCSTKNPRLQRAFGEEYDATGGRLAGGAPGFDQKAVRRSSEGRVAEGA